MITVLDNNLWTLKPREQGDERKSPSVPSCDRRCYQGFDWSG